MNEKIPLKSIALGIAVTIASGLFVSMAGMVEQTQALDENEVYQTSENTSGNYTEYDEEDYTVTSWWKAVLSDYDEALSPGGLTETEIQTEATTTEVAQTSETSVSETTVSDTMQNQPADTAAIPQQIERSYEEVKAGNFCFKTYGYGHGVGMSQNGANYYATYGGYDYKQILEHYYPGTYLSNTGTANSEYITVRGITGTPLNIISMVCYAEVGTTMNPEAIKAQAIAAYTNIKYNGGNTNGMAIKSNPPGFALPQKRSQRI